ncbi:hypothetical protein A5624_18775 [Mycobacterium sp. 1482292.6]|uniref:hypothetical protein n=1 Tax=unclassified Mycobacterium TaxID=2642494 RepID=UPI0007FD580F|nr:MULTISPECIES: hypothetical protein [unclassified Mycobacterium]OBJ09039.1 hypothetical protein A5624_18775 [Mycobacterium sp. 1482292.6]OBJ15499.1 hypothetical protein A5622_27090 [Mycobacterium sp. 1245801.1]
MVGVDRPHKTVIAPRTGAAVNSHRLLVAFLTVTIFICAIVGVIAAAMMGQTTAALLIALVAGGWFSAAAFC